MSDKTYDMSENSKNMFCSAKISGPVAACYAKKAVLTKVKDYIKSNPLPQHTYPNEPPGQSAGTTH